MGEDDQMGIRGLGPRIRRLVQAQTLCLPTPHHVHIKKPCFQNVRGPISSLHITEEEAPWPREGKGVAQDHPGSLMSKPPAPNPIHI